MLYAAFEALIQIAIEAAGWVIRAIRGIVFHAAADAGMSAATETLSFNTKERRRARRQLKRMAAAGDVDGLVRVYHRCGRGEHNRDLRIDALRHLARADASAAEPLLREVIEGPEDAWIVTASMEWAAKHRIAGLLDAVTVAKDDPRPVVAAHAASVQKRLCKATTRQIGSRPELMT